MTYSKNQLINPSAETGDTTGWETSEVHVVEGGTKGTKCFGLDTTASMKQDVIIPVQVPECYVSADFLPGIEPPEDDVQVGAYIKLEYEYADGSKDTFILPCVSGGGSSVD